MRGLGTHLAAWLFTGLQLPPIAAAGVARWAGLTPQELAVELHSAGRCSAVVRVTPDLKRPAAGPLGLVHIWHGAGEGAGRMAWALAAVHRA
jgi:hypothetical protein